MTIPLGFNFKWALGNRNIDSIVIDTDGILYAPQDFNSSTDNPIRSMMPYEADMTDRGFNNSSAAVSPISYLTTGVAGSRIGKIEFRNAGFYNDITTNDFINFQIWLYESTNIIEYRYGASNVTKYTLEFRWEKRTLYQFIVQNNCQHWYTFYYFRYLHLHHWK